MKTNTRLFVVLAASLVLASFQTAEAGDIFQWVDSREVVHFTDDYSRIPASVRKMPDRIIRHTFAESEQEAAPVKKTPTVENTDYDRAHKKDPYAPNETSFNEVAEDPISTGNVTVIVVNNSSQNKPCRGHGCSARFQPHFNDRRYIHPDVFNGGTRQYIHPDAFQQRRMPARQSNPNGLKRTTR